MEGWECPRTPQFTSDKDKQNAPLIPIAGHFKLIFCLLYAVYFEKSILKAKQDMATLIWKFWEP